MPGLNIDLDDIAPRKKPPPKRRSVERDTLIVIPGEKQGTWRTKDISDCSTSEFYRWLLSVYPQIETKEDVFTSIGNRRTAYQEVVTYHAKRYGRNATAFVN